MHRWKNVRFAEYLVVFVEVCRLGSFSAAARRRSVTHSSIVRQIDALEADLGVPLLTRSTRAVVPTSAGQRSEPGTMSTDDSLRLHNLQRIDGTWRQAIQPNKEPAIHGTESQSLWQMLMTKDQDLSLQRGPRLEQ
jgi:hypothetical protein